MSWLKKIFGSTPVENSPPAQSPDIVEPEKIDYKEKYLKYKKGFKKLNESISLIRPKIQQLIDEQQVAGFLLFSIVCKCGGKLELTEEDINIAKKLESDYVLDMSSEQGQGLIYSIKRKEKK